MRLFSVLLLLFAFYNSFCQVNVHEEPKHDVVFENEHLFVMDIQVKPGEASLPHAHNHNYCYQALQGGQMKLTNEKNESREVNLPSGYTGGIFTTHEEPYIHAFQNIDSINIRFIAVEHKSNIPNPSFKLKDWDESNIMINNDFFAMIKVNVPKLTSIQIDVPKPAILINQKLFRFYVHTGLSNIKLKEWAYKEANTQLHLSSLEKEDGEIILIFVK